MHCLATNKLDVERSNVISSYRKAYKPLLEIIPPTKRLGNMAIWENNTQKVEWNTKFMRVSK